MSTKLRSRSVLTLKAVLLAVVLACVASGARKTLQAARSPVALRPTPSGNGRLKGRSQDPRIPSPGHPIWSAQIDFTKPHNIPWSASDFAAIARAGMNRVEINLDWGDIEPQEGHYDFRLLDRYMAEAAQAHLKLLLLFWESLWGERLGKNPPPWLTAREVTSDGVPGLEPPWWDPASRQAYFEYVARAIDHVKASPGFGGVYASYGWLDSEWGPAPKGSHGVTGYAPADIRAYYRWLPQAYKTLSAFNRRWHSSYDAWTRIPAARPGDRLFPVYQRFRYYSVEEGFDAMSHLVREHTNATMLYSWGGDICGRIGPEVQGNDPDNFFRVAKKYHAIVNLDDANEAGLALLFGSMARSYGVPLLQEWTPYRRDLRAEIPAWLGHIGLAASSEVGEDFFIYPPPPQRPGFVEAWNAYQKWHATLAEFSQGETPWQPVAILVPTRQIALNTNLNAFAGLTERLGSFWRTHYVLPYFITDQEVARGVVSLQRFHAVVDLGNEMNSLPALRDYAAKHPVLKSLEEAVHYLRPYAAVNPSSDSIEVVPTVHGSSVWLSVANCNETQAYSGSLRFDPASIGLRWNSFHVSDARTGQSLPTTRSSDEQRQWRINLPPGGFRVFRLSPSR